MKVLSTIIFRVFLSAPIFAQTPIEGSVSIRFYDSTHKPVEGVFVQLIKSTDSTSIQTLVSDPYGMVNFNKIGEGSYFISASSVGYNNYFSPTFLVGANNLIISMPSVILQSYSLKEVVIYDKTKYIENLPDKTVVNISKNPLNAGSNIYDVLEHSPGVQIDQNDKISLQGMSSVTVMIDGKIVPISASDLANMLKGMSADAVEKIELITNPSAKYDAAGSGGIINIVLRKDKAIGTNGNINMSYGQGIYPKANGGFFLNCRERKFNIFTNFNDMYRLNLNDISLTRNFYAGTQPTNTFSQFIYNKIPINMQSGRLGCDFYASDKTTIGIVADGMNRSVITEGTTKIYDDSLEIPQSNNITNSLLTEREYNYSTDLNFKHTFDSVGKQLTANVDYASYMNQNYQNITTNYFDNENIPVGSPTLLYGDLTGALNIYSFKADYDNPININTTFSVGIKTSYVKTNNDMLFYNGANSSAPVDTSNSNHFIYTENINAAYINFNKKTGKLSFQLGLRVEQDIANGNQITTDEQFTRNNIQLFPNGLISDSISKNNLLVFSVGRRVNRPSFDELNPFREYVDPTSYIEGNPYLTPEYAYKFKLSDIYKGNFMVTLRYSRTISPITDVLMPLENEKNIIVLTSENLNYYDYYGLEATKQFQVTKWWNSNDNMEVYYIYYSADLAQSNLSTGVVSYSISTENDIFLNKVFKATLNAYYNSSEVEGYFIMKPHWTLSTGIQEKVLKGAGTLTLNWKDIFWTNITQGNANYNGYNESFILKRDSKVVNLTFSYRFGNSAAKLSKNTSGVDEEKNRAGNSNQ